MLLELAPCPADDVVEWLRLARRIVAELRSCGPETAPTSPEVIELWARLLDDWSVTAQRCAEEDGPFRWSGEFDPEVAEFMVHGLDQCLHSERVLSWITDDEASVRRPFTVQVVRAFVEALTEEGHSGRHYADQVLASFQTLLNE